jgi:2-polyprenyl-6-methoxyphenol hydroxylase-like FAD-dependent oxidoreductase
VPLRGDDAQWDFLDFLAEQARPYSTFHLRMQTEITSLIEDQDRVVGIRGNTPAGPMEIRADLIVGADGRNSVVRACSGLIVEDVGAPMDVCGCGFPSGQAIRI